MPDRADDPRPMQPAPDPDADAAAFDFLELLHADRTADRQRPLADYLQRFPRFQERIAREYLAATGAAQDAPAAEPRVAVDGTPTGDRLGAYRLRQLLGRGGQGAVYLAEDTRLQRDVALKILDRVAAVGSAQVERLRREANALARLDHPGICAIYEAELDGDRPFLAMRHVVGETLASRLQRAAAAPCDGDEMLGDRPRTTAAQARVLQFFERAAYALDAAHRAGLVHRDVKPANIMIDRDGMPVLLDFGLARQVDDVSLGLTLTGEVFGTLAYMSPEQLAGAGDLDARTDVYSLGVTLYECLTLELPFRKDTREVLEREIRGGAVRDPRAANPAISRDLATVLATAMDRDRERRYATARAFADDLVNVRERRPIQARAASVWLRLWRWGQRHPVVGSTAVVLCLLLVVMVWALWEVAARNRRLAFWQQQIAIVQRSEERPAEALVEMVELAGGDQQPQTREALHTLLARNHEAWRVPRIVVDPRPEPRPGSEGEMYLDTMALPAGGDRVVCGSSNGNLYVHATATGDLVQCIRAHETQINVVTTTVDRRMLVSGAWDGGVRWWPAEGLGDGVPAAALRVPDVVYAVAYDPPGSRLAVACGMVSSIHLFRTRRGGTPDDGPAIVCRGHSGRVKTIAFSRDGSRLCSLGELSPGVGYQELRIFDVATGGLVFSSDARELGGTIGAAQWVDDRHTLAVALREARCVLLFDDGDPARGRKVGFDDEVFWVGPVAGSHELMVCGTDGVRLLDPVTLAVRHVVRSTIDRPFQHAAWSPDGKFVAIAVRDSSVRIHEVDEWTEVARCKKHAAFVGAMVWRDDGQQLLTMDHAAVHGWICLARPGATQLVGHRGRVASVDFAADCRRIATGGEDGTVRLWDRTTARCIAVASFPTPRTRVRFSPSGQRVVAIGKDPAPIVLDVDAEASARELAGHTATITDVLVLAGDGADRAVTLGEDREARLWDLAAGKCLRTYRGSAGALRCAAIDEGRGWLATAGDAREVLVFDLGSGARIARLEAPAKPGGSGIHGTIRGLRFLPKSGRLIATAENSSAMCWDPGSDWSRVEVGIGGSTGLVLTDADERWILISEFSIEKMMWFRSDFTQHWRNPEFEPTSWITRLDLRRQGDVALAASRDGNVWLYDWQKASRYSVLRGEHGAVLDACFSPDGEWIAAAHRDGRVVVWPVDSVAAAARHRIPGVSLGR